MKNNLIIIGGTIAAGKSSLVDYLSNNLNALAIPELKEGDKLQEIILENLYKKERIHPATIQYYFLQNRYQQYKDSSKQPIISILDRGMWEDLIFARILTKHDKKHLAHFTKFLNGVIKKALTNYGKPKAYIYLKVDWKTFKERIYSRNREAEIKNFSSNESYFKELLKEYNNTFEKILKEWDIKPIVIDTVNKSKEEVIKEVMKKLEK